MPTKSKAKNHGSDEPFTFESSEGTIVVPSLAVAPKPKPMAILRAQADKNNALVGLLLLEAAAGDEAMAIIDELGEDETRAFTDAWKEHSGVGLGESRAS